MTFPFPPITNPITFRAAAALLAAGAWDVAPLEVALPGNQNLKLYVTYTRGAAGGAVDIQPFYSPRSVDIVGENWFAQTEYSAAVLAAGVDSQSRLQREYFTYQSTGAGDETFVIDLAIDSTVERVRVRARESGVVGNPGALEIIGFAYSNQS